MKEAGFYIIEVDNEITVGEREEDFHPDGSKNNMPWTILGTDEIFSDEFVRVIKKIDMVIR